MVILIIIVAIFHKLLKKNSGVGGVNDHLDVLDVISNVLGALRTIQRTLNFIYTEILSSSR